MLMNDIYRLESLTFNNFKLFGGEFTIHFNSNELVVFDGPNGHGKTTVYDAIELALTGTIRRFNATESQQTPKDVVVAHKNNEDCFVKLELSNGKHSIVIERRLKKSISNASKKIINFKQLWDLSLRNGDDWTLITQSHLNDLLGSKYLERDFTLFNYVEQEETAHFLKHKNERERAQALSVLFGDTVEMQEKISHLIQVEKRIVETLKDKLKDKVVLEGKGTLTVEKKDGESELSFTPLLKWSETPFEWDKEKINDMSLQRRNGFLSELHNIAKLVKHRDFFLGSRVRNNITQKEDVLLKSFVAFSGYFEELDELKKRSEQVALVSRVKSLIDSGNLDHLYKSNELDKAFMLVGYDNKNSFVNDLKQIVDDKVRNNESSKLVLELLNHRKYLEAHLKSQHDERHCFFCGTTFDDHSLLIESIDEKEKALKSVLTDDDKRINKLRSDFIENVLSAFAEKINQFLSDAKHTAPSAEHLSDLARARQLSGRLEGLSTWLQEEVVFSDLLLTYKPFGNTDEDIEEQVVILKDRIIGQFKVPPEGYDEINYSVNLESIFKVYFNTDSSHLRNLGIDDTRLKYQYIQQLFADSISEDIKSYEALKLKIDGLEKKKEVVSDLRKKIQESVGRYQKRLIKEVEIPFYIYSGKVLQTHQNGAGNGVFIKDRTGRDVLKNIRFVSDWNSDHDVINTMSSGQISAVVIALYLAINKVYSKGLGTLLIDDPVQTMDEINMISLVELLRNEFADKQIILSTHEDHVSKYFIYKFLKYRRKVKQVKLLDRKEYQLSYS